MTYVLSGSPQPSGEPLTLPQPPANRKRAAIPLAAAVVPMLGGGAMYAMTNSVIALMFAALGPIMMVATLWDSARGARRDKRVYRRELANAVADITTRVDALHDDERALRWRTHPDVAHAQASEVWREHPQRIGNVVIGRGTVRTSIEIARGNEEPQAQQLRLLAASLKRAPIVVPLDGTVCVRATRLVAIAVVRAFVIQLCLTHNPAQLRIVLGEGAEEWMRALPHVRYSNADRVVTIAPAVAEGTALGWCLPNQAPQAGARTVIDVAADLTGVLMRDSLRHDVAVEAISQVQAASLGALLAAKADCARHVEEVVHFAEVDQTPFGTLGVNVGRAGAVPVAIDIVTDGPHGVVVGTTGSGKSEFLVSWALALCRTYSPLLVNLLLVDFKGGTAFEPLRAIAHVAGIVTDLDQAMAQRAIKSLQGEIRRRESAIASVGARDITDKRVRLARLIIMVDEYAAMVRQLPELEAIFTDIAARGRALGLHLVLGAQRAAGAIREATLANTPLRIALRVTDAADSRAVLGTDSAAHIPGGAPGVGVAFVRRAADAAPQRFRSALSTESDAAAVAELYAHRESASSFWEPLPTLLPASDLPLANRGVTVGLADDHERLQRVPVVIEAGKERGWWVLGGPGTGKSTLASLLLSRHPGAVMVPRDPEAAWDCLTTLHSAPAPLVIWDDVDVAMGRWPEPWAREASETLERLVRGAGTQTWVLTAQRATGVLSRIADLLPGRVLFAVPSKLDHIAAGGASSNHDAKRPQGRALMAGVEVQFAHQEPVVVEGRAQTPILQPEAAPIGFVTRTMHAAAAAVAESRRYRAIALSALVPGTTLESTERVAFIGDAEQWQRNYAALEVVKTQGTLVVARECAADIRTLMGDRNLPPYAEAAGWWQYRQGEQPRRVRLDEA